MNELLLLFFVVRGQNLYFCDAPRLELSGHLQLEKYEVVEDCRVIRHMSLEEIHPGYFYTFQLEDHDMFGN